MSRFIQKSWRILRLREEIYRDIQNLQVPLAVTFRGQNVGKFYADILVEDVIIIEIKAVAALTPEHKAQLINYSKATGIEVGLLVNFGNPKLEYRRLHK